VRHTLTRCAAAAAASSAAAAAAAASSLLLLPPLPAAAAASSLGNAAGNAHYSQPTASKRSASPSFHQCSKRTVLSLFTEMFEARLTQGAPPPPP
jgi:hypothetical protein